MSASRCLTSAMLEVGMSHRVELSFDHDQVTRYCELSGDTNAIHRDVEAARLRFPGVADIIVPGGLIQIAITGIFGRELPGDGTLGLTFAPERFRKPVCPGDRIAVTVTISRVRGELVDFDIAITDGTGTRIGTARARVVAPDDAYRQWWAGRGGVA